MARKRKSSTRGDGITYGRGSGRTTALSRSRRSVTAPAHVFTSATGAPVGYARYKDTITVSPTTGAITVSTRRVGKMTKY